ncbi:hypothetical protein MBH78_12115 [Oceanimonas sp. NS1]|nr:hypothetical protein [Oceanimonas sp. NS1]
MGDKVTLSSDVKDGTGQDSRNVFDVLKGPKIGWKAMAITPLARVK